MRKLTLLIALVLLLPLLSFSQPNAWKSYYCKSNLNSITNDDNYLWYIQSNQLVRFDKSSGYFMYQTIPNNVLPCFSTHDSSNVEPTGLVKDHAGNLWLSTVTQSYFYGTVYGNALFKFDGTNWIDFTPTLRSNGFKDVVDPAFDQNNNMWFMTPTNGLTKYNGNTFTSWNDSAFSYIQWVLNPYPTPVIAPNNNIWMIVGSNEVAKFDGSNFTFYDSTALGISVLNGGFCLYNIYVSPDTNDVYAVSDCFGDGGYCHFDGKVWAHEHLDTSLTHTKDYFLPVFFDNSGNTYFSTFVGIVKENSSGSALINLPGNNSTSNWIYSPVTDITGNMWMSINGLLYEFDGSNFTPYSDPRGVLQSNVMLPQIIDKNGNHFMGYWEGSGITERVGDNFTSLISDTSKAGQFPVSTLAIDSLGRLWFAGEGENTLYYYDGTKVTPVSSSIMTSIQGIAIDKNNMPWLVGSDSQSGLDKIVAGNMYSITIPPSPHFGFVDPLDMTCIAIDLKGNAWMGNVGVGLIEFNGFNYIFYDTTNSGIASDSIQSLGVDSLNRLWVGTCDKGFSVFDGTNWVTYNISNSPLPYHHVEWFAFHDGKQYVATQKGFAIIDNGNWTVYTPSNSPLVDEDCESVVIDNQCDVWLATEAGLSELIGDCNTALSIIYGKATKQDGTPLGNTQVYLMKTDAALGALAPIDNTATDADGNYVFATNEPQVYVHVEPNQVVYQGVMPGYEDSALVQQLSPVIQPASHSTERNIKCTTAIAPGGYIILSGNVMKEGGGSAAGLRLFLMQNDKPVATSLTTLNGYFRFAGLTPGNYSVWADRMTVDNSLAPIINLKTDSFLSATLLLHPTYLELLSTTGELNVKQNSIFTLFPNPNSGHLNILFHSDASSNIPFQLFDMNGRMVLSAVLNNGTNQLNLEQLSNGVYFLRAETANEVIRRKLVIQK